jgi:hypothetical protein
MVSLSSLIEPGAQIPENVSQLPHYNTNIGMDLPADAAPIGVLADGSIYFDSYKMLTPNDISFLKQATGQSFDPATIDTEEASGTFRGDPLAAAIGFDRANSILGSGGLTGNVTASYLSGLSLDGITEGFQISQSELSAAFSVLADRPSSTVSVSG